MYRKTSNARTALVRLSVATGWSLSFRGRRVDLRRGRFTVKNRTTLRALGYLADLARREGRREIPSLVRWAGPRRLTGVKGWEEEALDWLRLS